MMLQMLSIFVTNKEGLFIVGGSLLQGQCIVSFAVKYIHLYSVASVVIDHSDNRLLNLYIR